MTTTKRIASVEAMDATNGRYVALHAAGAWYVFDSVSFRRLGVPMGYLAAKADAAARNRARKAEWAACGK